jgi:hypothetical protein
VSWREQIAALKDGGTRVPGRPQDVLPPGAQSWCSRAFLREWSSLQPVWGIMTLSWVARGLLGCGSMLWPACRAGLFGLGAGSTIVARLTLAGGVLRSHPLLARAHVHTPPPADRRPSGFLWLGCSRDYAAGEPVLAPQPWLSVVPNLVLGKAVLLALASAPKTCCQPQLKGNRIQGLTGILGMCP